MASEGGGYPAPPRHSGLTCVASDDGKLVIDGGHARFTVAGDVLLVSWDTVWTGRQNRRLRRADVRAVIAAPDTPSAASRHTAKLHVELHDGPPIVPLRWRPVAEVEWVVARLSEALRYERPDWSIERPTPPAPPAPSRGGPRPVKPIGPSPRVPPPPVPNCRATWRGDSLVIRVGPAAWWATHRETFPLLAVFALVAMFGLAALVVAFGGAPPARPLYFLFGVIGIGLGCADVWALRHIARVAGTSHVLHLTPGALRIASISRLKRDRKIIPRAQLAAAAVGETNDEKPSAELHLYFVDGARMELMTGRPVDELNWVAAQIAAALPKVPAKPQVTAGEPFRAGAILPYEPPRKRLREIDVRTSADGEVTILIPPAPSDRRRRITWIVPLIAFSQALLCVIWGPAGRLLGEVWPAAVFAIVVVAAWVVAKGILYLVRGDAPTVIGVDGQFLYADFPDRFRRRKRWPRSAVRDVQLVDVNDVSRRGGRERWVQIVFHDHTAPVRLCPHHSDADRQRLAAVLRAALDLPASP